MKLRVAVLALGCGVALGSWSARGEIILRMASSETMKDFGQRLSEWYCKKNSGVRFEIRAGQAYSGFAAMAASKAEIVESSRQVLHSEEEALRAGQGKSYLGLQVATEIAGISVNMATPVKEMSLYDLRQVLSGGVKNWKQVGGHDAPINIYGLDTTSGVGAFLEEEFMGDMGITSHAKIFASNSEMLAAVSHDANGIAYGTVDPRLDTRVRFLAIKASSAGVAVLPTTEAIHGKRYKLVRPLYFYFAGRPTSDLRRFAEWVLSPEGQLVVEAVGYYPLSATEREDGKAMLAGGKANP
ncbi:MAG: PstS family phosphate ABC transporter substrate-binding protein [Candidatus Acidiferrum sp.]